MINPIGMIKELHYLAYHDSLTGLFNRNYLYNKLCIKKFQYVYFVDINGLRKINKLGHSYGDSYIKNCVTDIVGKMLVDDCLVRYAGDEFLLFSTTDNLIETNDMYTVGLAPIESDLYTSINEADKVMLEQKAGGYRRYIY